MIITVEKRKNKLEKVIRKWLRSSICKVKYRIQILEKVTTEGDI